jgi:hypothetical protein
MAPNTCIRSAWLEYAGGPTVYLESAALGYFCSSLDLGYPVPREVIDNRPDRDGADDRTMLMGPRTVTVALAAVAGAGARMDQVAASFGPFMAPAARTNLHYVLDRGSYPERVISNMRAVSYDWPIAGPEQVAIALQWIAADPAAKDPVAKLATSWSGASGVTGRTYNLVYARVYPASGGGPAAGIIHSNGDLPVYPMLRIYGPITSAEVDFYLPTIGATLGFRTVPGYVVNTGHFLQIDMRSRNVLIDNDPTQPAGNAIDWSTFSVAALPAGVDNRMSLVGQNATGSTQVQASWNDGYLT